MRQIVLALTLLYFAIFPLFAHAAEPFELKDGDRVVFVGSTLIEREQRYGYWETMLTSHFPDRNVTFRNLGWSGDTVFGEARAGFDTPADGYRRLKEHVLALKPTVIFIGYGTNESFEGEAGLPRFVEGMNKLLDDLAPAKARVVLLSPLPQEELGPPLPDSGEHNKDLRLYRNAIEKIAAKLDGCRFVDLYFMSAELMVEKAGPLTDNGIHLTPYGYWRGATILEKGLGLKPAACDIRLKTDGNVASMKGAKVERDNTKQLTFDVTFDLPPISLPSNGLKIFRIRTGDPKVFFRAYGLPKGKYTLTIDGKAVETRTGDEWNDGTLIDSGPSTAQGEKLRETIIAKNRLYFYRWRPQNETYLFGFRKHEQGQNAKEIPEFDPLIEKMEAEIAKLRKPAKQTWELVRQEEERK